MNTDTALDEAIIHPELRHIKFFNGRLLTGGDLEEEQTAQHAHSRHLGEAIGEGVAFGLQVTPAPASPPDGPVVTISKGLAVNRAGQTLRLECEQRIALTRPADPAVRDACIFADCDPPSPGETLASGTGYYVLTIGPASRPDGKAPVSGLGNTTAICNSRYSAEGVKFSVFRLTHPANAAPLARSRLAQACFGLAPDISTAPWPASLPAKYGWETLMPAAFDGDYNVPLAVFEWTSASTVGFVKRWPVRRRIVRRRAVEQWDYFTSERRVAEGEAMFLDFQDDVAAMGAAGFAGVHFSFLPPGGVLPAATVWKTFLGPLAPAFATPIDASLWPRLLRDTFTREPVAIPANAKMPGDPSLAAIKVYEVPGRADLLFARSPLGRLRIFPGQGDTELLAVIIRDANRCLRICELVQSSGPIIADDLPGPMAELWFLRAAKARELLTKDPKLDQAEKEMKDADAEAEKTKQAAAKVKSDLENALQGAGSGARTGAKSFENLMTVMRSTTEALNLSEALRYAEEKQSRTRTFYTQYQASTQATPAMPSFEGNLRYTPTTESWSLLLRALRGSAPLNVKIVNGRTTDLDVPPEQTKSSGVSAAGIPTSGTA